VTAGAARTEAAQAVDRAARDSYGRLLAFLASRTRDIAAAEDALSEAFATALRRWPETGVPRTPEAWLLTVARRAAGKRARSGATAEAALPALTLLTEETMDRASDPLPDERLKLMFACAHPAIDRGVRTALMLQTVLGLDAARIARAFVVQPAAMGQRVSRAKAKIKAAAIPFRLPEPEELEVRLDDVLLAIYAAYGLGWDVPGGLAAGRLREDLAGEALFLARLVTALLPAEPEPKGLLALILYCEARREARRDASGGYVPLAEQDRDRWNGAMVAEAERTLEAAARAGRPGRFQTEAAIQSVQVQAPRGRSGDPAALAALYDFLVTRWPSLGAEVARAVVHASARGPERGLRILDALPPHRVASYQPYWAARLDLCLRSGDVGAAEEARARAIELSDDPAVRDWLRTYRGGGLSPLL
jgi:RNA polymerase sigma-70 factor, ECF subfamily